MITNIAEAKRMLSARAAPYHLNIPHILEASKAPHDTSADTPASSSRPAGDTSSATISSGTVIAHGLPTPTSSKSPTTLSSFHIPCSPENRSALCDDECHMKPRTPTRPTTPRTPTPPEVEEVPTSARWLRGRGDRRSTWPAYFGGRKPERGTTFCSWSQQDQKRGFHLKLFEKHCTLDDDMGYGYTSGCEN